MEKHLLVLPGWTYAGHCTTGKSNKDWVACLAIEQDMEHTRVPEPLSEETTIIYLSLHGPHGGNLLLDTPKGLTLAQAKKHFLTKCREKGGKGYVAIPFEPYLQAFGRPLGLPLSLPASGTLPTVGTHHDAFTAPPASPPLLPYVASAVRAVSWERVQSLIADPNYGITEKVDGERCLVHFDGEQLRAYNRRGMIMSAPPKGAQHLCDLGKPFIVDGERLTGEMAGHYVVFDLLEWKGIPFIHRPYDIRITLLEDVMQTAGLLKAELRTASWKQALRTSSTQELTLLVAETGSEAQHMLEQIQYDGGEGIIIRRLKDLYAEGALKYKFVSDLDAFVIGINDGVAGGSLQLGLLRPGDQAIIPIGNVRSGLSESALASVHALLAQGERPVFRVTYLPKRTVGLSLVEPRTTWNDLRNDKRALECTTDQFGEGKADLIAQAEPINGIALL